MTVMFRCMVALVFAVTAFFATAFVMYEQGGKRSYTSPQDVPGHFPIAVLDMSGPALIDWQTYTRESAKYRDHLIANAAPGVFVLADGRQFELKPLANGQLELAVQMGLQRMRAGYAVEMGNVRPMNLRAFDRNALLMAALAALFFGLASFFMTRRKN